MIVREGRILQVKMVCAQYKLLMRSDFFLGVAEGVISIQGKTVHGS